jgi:hypothetical protein
MFHGELEENGHWEAFRPLAGGAVVVVVGAGAVVVGVGAEVVVVVGAGPVVVVVVGPAWACLEAGAAAWVGPRAQEVTSTAMVGMASSERRRWCCRAQAIGRLSFWRFPGLRTPAISTLRARPEQKISRRVVT